MIVISGALVLVALILLVLGLTMTELSFVYASIAVSLVSFVFLVIGILQRRGEQPSSGGDRDAPEVRKDEQADTEPDDVEPPVAVVPAARTPKGGSAGSVPVRARAVQEEEPEQFEDDEELLEGGGAVLVVPGRPRYHVEGCRYLSGKSAEEIDVLDAREDGFTACGVCKPDDALEELYADDDLEREQVSDDDVYDEELEDELDVEEEELEPVPAVRGRAARPAAVSTAAPTRTTAPVRSARVSKTPARSGSTRPPAAPTVAEIRPARAVRAAKAPAKAASARAGSASATRQARVVVIPDRGRFHLSDCRFVRDTDDTQELTRGQAAKQGYAPCGVCKP